jgi:hypothetical protein
MRISYPLFGFKIKATTLTAAAIIMVVLLAAANVTMTNAQQQQEGQQQLSTSQPTTPPMAQNGTTAATTLFESTQDSFRVRLPEGWVIQDVNNTRFILAAEVTEGYGILAQLCPAEEREEELQQQEGAFTNISSGSCQQQQLAQEEIIHIIRYPNLGARLGIALNDINGIVPDSVLNYQIQKLQEVGYRDINIVNITDAIINIHYTTAQDVPAPGTTPLATVPARFVKITYSTDSAPSEMRSGYLFLTATNATPPNEMITGYSIFYEGRTAARAEDTTQSASLLPVSPAAARILASFELIASEEVAQSIFDAIAQQAAVGNEPNDQAEDAAGEEAEDDDE